ncbi:227 kDa spindle- and centromere-associated protein-like isoform X1 [Sycon ciliatum]|uniref:227 kDa spindle- and centromere-associated protein-like isoform X1 n=1 Tax=Sycon ciliatum TaxID=27933 RepID=UPI0031F60B64
MSRLTPSALKFQLPDMRADSKQKKATKQDESAGSESTTPSSSAHHSADGSIRGLRSMSGLLGGLGRRKDQTSELTDESHRYLQEKFESAKEDFQHQTSELLRELSKVYSEKDALEKERDELTSQLSISTVSSRVHSGSCTPTIPMLSGSGCAAMEASRDCFSANITDVQRLRAETIVLSRALAMSRGETTLSEQHSSDESDKTRSICSLIEEKLEAGLLQLQSHVGEHVAAKGDAERTPSLSPSWNDAKQSMLDALLSTMVQFTAPSCDRSQQSSQAAQTDNMSAAQLPDDIELSVLVKERDLLRTDLLQVVAERDNAKKTAQEDLAKWKNKARSKQSTLVKVQAEKDQLYTQYSKCSDRVAELESECTQVRDELAYMQSRLLTRNDGAAQVTEGLREEIVDLQAQLGEARRFAAGLDSSLINSGTPNRVPMLEEEIAALSREIESLGAKLTSTEQIAESRKSLADELAVEKQSLLDQLNMQANQHKELLERKEQEILSLQGTVSELEHLQEAISSLEALKDELSRSHKDCLSLQQKLEENRRGHASQLSEMQQGLSDAEDRCSALSAELNGANETVDEARAKVIITERKAAATLKDMKHQLTLESKRVSRLQQDLQILLAEEEAQEAESSSSPDATGAVSLARAPVEMMKRMTSLSSAKFEDMLSSIGNLSMENGSFLKKRVLSDAAHSSNTSSHVSSPDIQEGAVVAHVPVNDKRYLYKSFSELEAIICNLQTEKRDLGERVSHLEQNAAGMADELVEKSAIIRSCLGSQTSVGTSGKSMSSSILSPSMPANLFKKLTSFGESPSDSPTHVDDSDNVDLLQRRVEEGIIKVTHLEQTVGDLMADNNRLQVERNHLLQIVDSIGQ